MVDATLIVGMITTAITAVSVISYITFELRKTSRTAEKQREDDLKERQAAREADRKELLGVMAEDRKERRERDLIMDAKLANICDRLTRLETRFNDRFGATTATQSNPGAEA